MKNRRKHFYHYDTFRNEIGSHERHTNWFRYCGEYFDLSSGTYYLRNRYYNPGNGRFLTEAPIRDGLNWYTYSVNNPVMFFDPFGLIPTPLEAAQMTQAGYGSIEPLSGGWSAISFSGNTSDKVTFYSRKVGTSYEYTMVNIGFLTVTLGDDISNASSLFALGYSDDAEILLDIAAKFIAAHPKTEVTFVGHSKGGAEAMVDAIYFNKAAILFNPVPISLEEVKIPKYPMSTSTYDKSKMTSYVVDGETLNNWIGNPKYGNMIPLDRQVYPEQIKWFGLPGFH